MSLSAFLVAMVIARLRMALVMEHPTAEVFGTAAPTDTAVGEVAGMQAGALAGDILLIQAAIHTRLAHHLPYMFSRFWLSPSS
jgi:hypothetical protein